MPPTSLAISQEKNNTFIHELTQVLTSSGSTIHIDDQSNCDVKYISPDNTVFFPSGACLYLVVDKDEQQDDFENKDILEVISTFKQVMTSHDLVSIENAKEQKDWIYYAYENKTSYCMLWLMGPEPSEHDSRFYLGCSDNVAAEKKTMTPILKQLGLLGQGIGLEAQLDNPDFFPYFRFHEHTPFIGGGETLLRKEKNDIWTVIRRSSQEILPCSIVEKYHVPPEVHRNYECLLKKNLKQPSNNVRKIVQSLIKTTHFPSDPKIMGGVIASNPTTDIMEWADTDQSFYRLMGVKEVFSVTVPAYDPNNITREQYNEDATFVKEDITLLEKTLQDTGFEKKPENNWPFNEDNGYRTGWKKGNITCVITSQFISELFGKREFSLSCSDTLSSVKKAVLPYMKTLNAIGDQWASYSIMLKKAPYTVLLGQAYLGVGSTIIIKTIHHKDAVIYNEFDYPPCSLMKQYNVPKSVYWSCLK